MSDLFREIEDIGNLVNKNDDTVNLKEGERRFVSVLFTDMKGFTNLSQKLDPEELDVLMGKIFSLFEGIVKKYGGYVEKFIGDALVAVFGAKKIHEDDPKRAISCALDMLTALEKLNYVLKPKNIELNFRTGINTGLVAIGKRGEFDVVTGEALAIASRLESYANENTIMVSESTKEKTETDFIFAPPVELYVKGVDKKINAYKVLGYNYYFFNFTSPFFGRKKLIDQILRKYLKFSGEKISGYYITGEQGSGKTRIIAEFYNRLKNYPDFNGGFLFAKAGNYPNYNFGVIANLILNYLRTNKNEPKEKIRELLNKKLHLKEQFINNFCMIVDQKNLKENEFDEFFTLYVIIHAILENHKDSIYSSIFYIDSVNLIDKNSRDFLRYFFDKSDIKPFFLISSDSLDLNIIQIFLGIDTITLDPLNESEAYEMITSLSNIDLSEENIKKIIEQTKGNPFFIEEYIRYINKTGDVHQVPTTIQNLILASFEKYESGVREILQKCSIFQHFFTYDYIKDIHLKTGGMENKLEEAIQILVKDNVLVFEKGIYRFRQDLIKEVIYNSILIQNKKILHRLIGFLLMKNEKQNFSSILFHLTLADEFVKAREYILKYNNALSIDNIKYIDLILNNLEIKKPDEKFDLLNIKFTILFNNGRLDEANDTLNLLIDIAFHELSYKFFAMTYHMTMSFFKAQFDLDNVCFYGKKAIYYYQKLNKNPGKNKDKEQHSIQDAFSNIVYHTCNALFFNNQKEEAKKYAELLPKENFDRKRLEAIFLFYDGYYEKGIEILDSMFSEKMKEQDDIAILFLGDEIIDLLYEMGYYEKLISYTDQIKDKFPFNYRFLSKFYSYLGIALCYTKNQEKGFEYLKKAEYFSNQLKNDYFKARVFSFLSEGFLIANDLDRAISYAQRGIRFAIKNKDHLQIFEFNLLFLLIYVKTNNHEGISIFLKEAEVYVDRNFLFNFKYKSLFLYLKYKYSDYDEKTKDEALKQSYDIVMEKLNKIKNPEHKKMLLKIRYHQVIIDEYEKKQKTNSSENNGEPMN